MILLHGIHIHSHIHIWWVCVYHVIDSSKYYDFGGKRNNNFACMCCFIPSHPLWMYWSRLLLNSVWWDWIMRCLPSWGKLFTLKLVREVKMSVKIQLCIIPCLPFGRNEEKSSFLWWTFQSSPSSISLLYKFSGPESVNDLQSLKLVSKRMEKFLIPSYFLTLNSVRLRYFTLSLLVSWERI